MNGEAFAPGEPGGFRIPTNRPKDWFIYPVRFTAVAPDDADTITVQIDAASDFYLTAITQFATIDGSTAVLTSSTYVMPKVTVQITDQGSTRNLFNAAVPLAGIAGDGNHPHRLIHPRLFYRNSAISVTLTSVDDTNTYENIWLNLEGFRIYGT